MNISAIASHLTNGQTNVEGLTQEGHELISQGSSPDSGPSFSKMLQHSIHEVDSLLKTSDKKMSDVAVGKSENLHEAMISFEKADVAFKLLVQVRNKAMDAYHEIMRMQV